MYEYTTFSVFEFTKSTLISTFCIYYVANRQTENKQLTINLQQQSVRQTC